MQKPLWIAAGLLALVLAIPQLLADDVASVDVRQAQQMRDQGALLLDVREPEEYAALHAPGTKLIPLGELQARLPEIEAYKDKPVAVVCRSGRRSARAVELLKAAGFTRVSNVEGGMLAWQQSGLEVVRQQ
ncbi:MAG: rhodanese-like domain-containing protein [Sideroxydans sp.]